MKNLEKPQAEQLTPQQKRQLSTKQFLKMKRRLHREEKSNEGSFQQIKQYITSSQAAPFHKEIMNMSPQIVFSFLFSQDQLKRSPYIVILQHKDACLFIQALNEWALNNSEFLQKQLEVGSNEIKGFDWHNTYSRINKVAALRFSQHRQDTKGLIQMLGKKGSIYFKLSVINLDIELINVFIKKFPHPQTIIHDFYLPLLTQSDLACLSDLKKQLESMFTIIQRQQLWKELSFVKKIRDNKIQNFELLELKEIDYNFLHELATQQPMMFMDACELIKDGGLEDEVIKHLEGFMMQVDRSGQTPLDKILRSWNFNQIEMLFNKYSDLAGLVLSTSCLNKILSNRSLKKREKEQLIMECLSGKISEKGYIKLLKEIVEVKLGKSKSKLYSSSLEMNEIKIKEVQTVRYTFSLCYSKDLLRMDYGTSSGLYPLASYLNTYKERADLQVIDALWLNTLNKKDIKKRVLLFQMDQKEGEYTMSPSHHLYKEFEILYLYYQPLWKTITFLKHGDVFEHLVNKCHLNICQIKIERLRADNHHKVDFFGSHFLRCYLLNSPDLGHNALNQTIVQSVLNCKDKEKQFHQFNLYNHLIISLADVESFHSSQQWVPSKLRGQLKLFFEKNRKAQYYLTAQKLYQGNSLLEVVYNPLVKDKIKSCSLLSLEGMIEKITKQEMIERIETNVPFDAPSVAKRTQALFKLMLKKIGQPYDQKTYERKLFLENKKDSGLSICQEKYFTLFNTGDLNDIFFQGLWKCKRISKADVRDYPFFRLRTKQDYLVEKMTALLINGIDVYFSKYDHEPELGNVSKLWASIIKDMWESKTSLLNAILSSQEADFKNFSRIFKQSITVCSQGQNNQNYQLCDMALGAKRDFSFVSLPKRQWNISFVLDLFDFANEHKKGSYSIEVVLERFFLTSINALLLQISKIETAPKTKKDSPLVKAMKKKKQLQQYFNTWIPKISKAGKNDEQKAAIFKRVIEPLLESCEKRRLTPLFQGLLKNVQLHPIFLKKYSLAKIAITPDADILVSKEISSLDEENFQKWLRLFSSDQVRPSLVKTYTKFSPEGLQAICIELGKRYDQEKNRPTPSGKSLNQTLNMITLCFRLIPANKKIEALLKLKEFADVDKALSSHYRSMLMKVDKIDTSTAALIFLDPSIELVFYLNDSNLQQYSNLNFYHKCSDQAFNAYICNIKKYHKYCPSLSKHLKTVCSSLVEAEAWSRLQSLFKVEGCQKELTQILLIDLHLTSNKRRKMTNNIVQEIISSIFKSYQDHNIDWNDQYFLAAFELNYQKAIQVMKPEYLSFNNIKQCLTQHPESASSLLKVQLIKQSAPQGQIEWKKYSMPFISHYVYNYTKQPYLVDQIRLENKLNKVGGGVENRIKALKKVWRSHPAMIPYWEELIGQQEAKGLLISQDIFNNRNINSLAEYQKVFPNIKASMKEYLVSSERWKVKSLQNVNEQILNMIIKEMLTDDKEILYCFLMRLIDRADIKSIDSFLSQCKLGISYEYLKEIDDYFNKNQKINQGIQQSFFFLKHLFAIKNQHFVMEFIKRYKIFEIYPIQQYSPTLLTVCCTYRLNQLLHFSIEYIQRKYKVKAVFAADEDQLGPRITEAGTFFMPVQTAIDFNFYQCYFLIKGSNNQCPKFKLSGRFVSQVDPEPWKYIPELQRRIKINNSLMKILKESLDLEFRTNVILPSVFQLEAPAKSPPKTLPKKKWEGADYPRRYMKENPYRKSLYQFINSVVTGYFQQPSLSLGILERLGLLFIHSKKTQIPNEELTKRHPAQMHVINNLKEFFLAGSEDFDIVAMIEFFPEYQHLFMTYNPSAFFKEPRLLKRITDLQNDDINKLNYLKAIQINLDKFTSQHASVLKSFIHNQIYSGEKISLSQPFYNSSIKRELLIMLLLELSINRRSEGKYEIHHMIVEEESSYFRAQQYQQAKERQIWTNIDCKEKMFSQMITHLNPREGVFDLMFWNKMIQSLDSIQKHRSNLKMEALGSYDQKNQEIMLQKYTEILTQDVQKIIKGVKLQEVNTFLTTMLTVQQKQYQASGIYIESALLMNSQLLIRFLQSLRASIKESFKDDFEVKINFTAEKQAGCKMISPDSMELQVGYIIGDINKTLVLGQFDLDALKQNLASQKIFRELKNNAYIEPLNVFFAKEDRHPFFKGYRFEIEADSFSAVKDIRMLEGIFDNRSLSSNNMIAKVIEDVQKMEEELFGARNVKLYNMADIYGPINFNEQTDKNRIIDCLTFYELLALPKDKPIRVVFKTNQEDSASRNKRMQEHLTKYFEYYINSAREDNPQQIDISSELTIFIQDNSKEGQSFKKVVVNWDMMGAWTISSLTSSVLHYCSELSSKIQQILDVRVSFLSLLNYYQENLKAGQNIPLEHNTEQLLFGEKFRALVESILLMITEDIRNIMSIVKGIIITLDINQNREAKGNIIISETTSATSINYEVRQSLLYVKFNLQVKSELNKKIEGGDDIEKLVSRKDFLDTVFVSAQFLTDYFIQRNNLNRECLNISTSISKKLNSTHHLHIDYKFLYKYIENMRKTFSIKDIDSFLNGLRYYLLNNMERAITHYLSSQELANRNQILLMNKCQAINKNISLEEVEKAGELLYRIEEDQSQNGLKEIGKIMNDIGNDENTKNTFLIQIYKSHYSAIVSEGMTFVVGYQSNQKKAQVVSIKKAQNINEINIVELEYLLLVSKTIPTVDQLNPKKIIRIFVTDFNRNLYKLNSRIQEHFLNLLQDSEDRHISHFAPILPPDLKLVFNLPDSQTETDTRETKIFLVNLPKGADDLKAKMRASKDIPLSPINSLKRSVEYKLAIQNVRTHLKESFRQNFMLVIEPPSQNDQNTANANFDHLTSLVTSDLIDTINKLEYDVMRNPKIDRKLSIQKKMTLNQSSIIQLRKKCILSHFRCIRIRFVEEDSKVCFAGKQMVIQISYMKTKILPSSSQYLTAIIEEIIKKKSSNLPKDIEIASKTDSESTELLLKLFDILNVIDYQLEQVQSAKKLIKAINNEQIKESKIVIDRNKAGVSKGQILILSFNLETVERQFYLAEQIAFACLKNKNPQASFNENEIAQYLPETNSIEIRNSLSKHQLFVSINDSLQHVETKEEIQEDKNMIKLNTNAKEGTLFFLVDEHSSITSNYFFNYCEGESVVKSKQHETFIGRQSQLYLHSSNKVNLNFSKISVTKKDLINKQNTSTEPIYHQKLRNGFNVQLVSNNVHLITVKTEESAHYLIHFAGNNNPFHGGETASIIISSNSEMDINCTKFIELQIFKKKAVQIKDKEKGNANADFRQTSQIATSEVFKAKQEQSKNVENLVYVINDDCKKYLTRAGQPRTDYIQLCDGNHNPVNYNKDLDVKFVHINRLAIVEPQIIKRGMQFGLKWTPTVRGHYYLYINQCLLNPAYEIGVCAAQADHINSKVTGPKVTKICFCEESEIMLDLRDSYGNIYSQLQEQIIGDELLIDLQPDKMAPFLKVEKSQINKYGLKKVKFNFNYNEGQQNVGVDMNIFLNRQKVLNFQLQIEGYSLKQRKKLLEADLNSVNKKFYKSVNIHRSRFLEELMTIAEKSLHVNLSIKFVNEPGIDAGGLKREFYDMVGNEMKNEKNPFFLEVNKDRIEYFLNPQILRNKKKCEYMEMWGKYLANAILNSYLIGMNFSPVFIKMLYGQQIDYEDMLEVLPEEEAKQYKYLLTAPPQAFEDLCLFFTVVLDKKKAVQVELKQGGQDIQVTHENVKQYLQLSSHVLLTKRYKGIFEAFRKGFDSVVDLEIIRKWIRPTEFWCLTAGTKQITAEMVLSYTNFSGNHIENISGWFRRYITQASRDILLGFLKFTSGSSSIDFTLTSKLTVTFENAGDNPKKLPISHTCWKEIVVPKYKNYEIMKKLLNAAFIYCCEGFGFG